MPNTIQHVTIYGSSNISIAVIVYFSNTNFKACIIKLVIIVLYN